MGPTRFPNGQALGFVNQFNYRNTTAGDITALTTPNVTLGGLFYTNNTGVVTITNFVLDDTANRLVNYEGKIIRVFTIDSATQFANAGPIFLTNTGNLSANGSIDFMFSRGNWFEVGRNVVTRNPWVSASAGTAASITIDNGTKLIIFTGVSATQQIKAISGGYQGQLVTLTADNTGGIVSVVMTGGNIVFPGTNMFALVTNNAIQLQKIGSSWRFLMPGTAGLIN